ncbi:Uncaracterized surface protein containing fasciclin (FAS1) repeats [Cohaesibacter sp. ES.047]|uniref:fasciclin domain-containing protein n=1 Tax=Cohaesibacter sp. ES.047 TaxID=1798205 RepID=UPI000BB9252E|nr:fasciclin domain-containing protein [Cohaesibacter sp. ES.047]SNY92415.1 Uncaracterized surface protein containing fasciclin (FAS1) repeats [Cohaesibacter sp. ES.047]
MKLASTLLLASTLAFSALPAYADNIVETAKKAGTFETLLTAATAAGLAGALADTENLTVFAPTDEAFAALPAGTVESLLKPENKDQLVAILSYHVVPNQIAASDIKMGSTEVQTLKSSGDQTITVKKSGMDVMIDDAKVIKADIKADNGVIHVIDKVIMPSS